MSRTYALSSLSFAGVKVTMESFIDPWGEDDSLIGDVVAGGYDETESLAIWAYLAETASAGSIMLDVGAYAGLYSLFALKLNPNIKVCAFEASSITYGRLTKNIVLNMLESRIAPARMAVWKEAGLITFKHRYGIFSICAGDSAAMAFEEDHSEVLPATTLDALIDEHTPPPGVFASKAFALLPGAPVAAMKMDVEGAELGVLEGSPKLLSERRPIIICEILEQDALQRITALVGEFKYDVREVSGERNFILCPREKSTEFEVDLRRWKANSNFDMNMTLERQLMLSIS